MSSSPESVASSVAAASPRRGRRPPSRQALLGVVAAGLGLTAAVWLAAPDASTGAEPLCESGGLPDALEERPGPDNTGVPKGTRLTRSDGDYRTTEDGQVVDRLDIEGRLLVEHDDVRVRCSRIGRAVVNEGRALQMWSVTIGDANGIREGSAVRRSDYTLRRADVFGTFDGLKAEGDVDVRDSYIHDLYRTSDESQPGGMTHNDAVQIDRGSNMVFENNTFHAWSFTDGESAGENLFRVEDGTEDGPGYMTSIFMITGRDGDVRDVVIANNVMRGRTSRHVHVVAETEGVRLLHNVVGRENRDYPRVFSLSDGVETRGNVFFDGGSADLDDD